MQYLKSVLQNRVDSGNQLGTNNPAPKAGLLLFGGLLVLLAIIISFLNHQSGTYLSGWDTLHPEFNFRLAFERLFSGVFRSEQGLGAVAAHSHMADLPRVVLLAFSSLVLPASMLRYLFISLCFVVGGLGSFIFIKRIILRDVKYSSVFAFLGGLFYLLNLGTLQQFYVPFEMFTVQFATLPWLFYFAAKYLFEYKKKNLVFFGLVTLLSTPMAFASTLWFAYFLVLILFLGIFIKSHYKKVIMLVIVTLAINSFWLLPAAYFVLSGNAGFVPLAKANKIFSQEAFSYNKSYGTLADALILKNFLLDWFAFDGKDSFAPLFTGWIEYLAKPGILTIGYFLSAVALLGVLGAFLQRQKIALALILPGLLAIIFLINQNPPLDWLFTLFREKIPLFEEALRFPFTKFSIIFAFILACFFGLGQKFGYSLVNKASIYKLSKIILVIQLSIFSVLFFIYMRPVFEGNFISKKVQVAIPQEYFDMFSWFNKQPDGRVATFPVHSFWGWIYYKWGFQGAQFISFGIKQPVMDRDYDRWNKNNEEYFRQISLAIYSQDVSLLEKVLAKYNISYLMVDRNVLAPGKEQDQKVLFNDEIESLFSSSSQIIPVQKFGNLSVYLFKPNQAKPLVTTSGFVSVNQVGGQQDIDWVYNKFGSYIVSQKPLINLPFRSLTDNQNILNPQIFTTDGQKVQMRTDQLGKGVALSGSNYLENESTLPARIETSSQKGILTVKLKPKLFQGNKDPINSFYQLENPVKDLNNLLINADNYSTFTNQGNVFLSTNTFNNLAFYDSNAEKVYTNWAWPDFISAPLQICALLGGDQEVEMTVIGKNGIRLSGKNTQGCIRIPFSGVLKKGDLAAYKSLLHIRFQVESGGQSFGHYCIFDKTLSRCIKEQEFLPSGPVEDFVTVDPSDLNRLELVFFLDAINNQEEISYTNLSFAVNNPVNFLSIPPDDLKNAFKSLQIQTEGDKLQIGDFAGIGSFSSNLLDHDSKARFCSTIFPKSFTRSINLNQGFIEYSSEYGSSCDYFPFPNLPHNVGYLVSVESQNVSGLPLRMCIVNTSTKRCDLFVSIPEDKNFNTQLFLLPPMNDGGVGYNVHFDNYSVAKITSKNRIKQLKIIPFPYYWISKMGFGADDSALAQGSNLEIDSIKQFFPGAISVSFINQSNPGLIILDHSFESGWWMSGGQHVEVNGWANGWLVPPGKKTVTIFYWPQLLEWGGFVLMVGTFVFACLLTKDKQYG